MLTNDVAQQIVNEIIEKLGRNINIMNNQGIIIASGDLQRIGAVHEGALKALESGETFTIYEDNYKGSKPGINMPILFNSEHVGVVGITGDPDELAEFGALVVTMTELMLHRVAFLDESEWRERLRGFLLDECLKRDPDLQKVIHKTKPLNMVWEGPFQITVFQVKEPKTVIESNLNVYRKIAEVLTGEDSLYDFIDDEHFVILKAKASHDSGFLESLKNHFQTVYNEVRFGTDDIYFELYETRERYERVLRALSLIEEQVIHTSKMSTVLLLDTTNLDERKTVFTNGSQAF
jgi:carbohydrate diacid regulator